MVVNLCTEGPAKNLGRFYKYEMRVPGESQTPDLPASGSEDKADTEGRRNEMIEFAHVSQRSSQSTKKVPPSHIPQVEG
ncbi:hypothetical protein VTL71DRAFT_2451 [Oculimacula yallundae]|uniref:Uncharacterized protein n=1 Tax=Oculimacula yallundae TaxID=86028 RepID=A0ABR4C904_9HELO